MRDGLHLDFCSHEAAKYAVMRWHYSRRMPKSKLVRIGVWEDKKFSGAIIYGLGANRHLARPFGLRGYRGLLSSYASPSPPAGGTPPPSAWRSP